MDHVRFLECLAADRSRLRAVAASGPSAPVPTCPGWTVADLTRHVGHVYLHKTLAMREGAEPEQWPPDTSPDETPLDLLDRGYAGLLAEFTSRKPDEPAGTWYAPDQTVGFWIRRMAHETVIHRIDAELATGRPVADVPADLAIDGIDELLKVFVAYAVTEWPDHFTDILDTSRTYTLRTDGAAWQVRTAPGKLTVEDADAPSDVTIEGPPAALLRWTWNRHGEGVTINGPTKAIDQLRHCIALATQ